MGLDCAKAAVSSVRWVGGLKVFGGFRGRMSPCVREAEQGRSLCGLPRRGMMANVLDVRPCEQAAGTSIVRRLFGALLQCQL